MDHSKIYALLEIVSGCAAHSGKLSAISGAAMAELLQINEDIRSEAVAESKKAQQEIEAAALAAREAREKAAAEKADVEDAKRAKLDVPSKTDTIASNNARRV